MGKKHNIWVRASFRASAAALLPVSAVRLGLTPEVNLPPRCSSSQPVDRLLPQQKLPGRRLIAYVACFAHCFSNLPHEQSDPALQWCGRALERAYRSGRIDALAATRLLLCCGAAGLPAFGIGAGKLVDALAGEQAGDGSFATPVSGDLSTRLAPTLDAMQALVTLCAAF